MQIEQNESPQEKARENEERMMEEVLQRFNQYMAIEEEGADQGQTAKRSFDAVVAELTDSDGAHEEPRKKKVKT